MSFIRNPKDFLAGLLFILFGIAFIWLARDYGFGTARRMGPAFFPIVLSGILIAIGLVIGVRGVAVTEEPPRGFTFKGLVLVIVGTLLFGLLVRQNTYAFAIPGNNDFTAVEYDVINQSGHELDSVFVGFFVEQDVGKTDLPRYFTDDLPEPRIPQGNYVNADFSSLNPNYDPVLCPTDTFRVRGFTMTDDDGDEGATEGASSFLLLGHTTDPTGISAPRAVQFQMYVAYLPGRPYPGGQPTIDTERFEAMSAALGSAVDPVTGMITTARPEEIDRGDYFSLVAGHANAIEPGKRPRSTLQGSIATKDGELFLVAGCPGGDNQTINTMQTFLNIVEFGMNVQQAVEQPYAVSSAFRGALWPHAIPNKLMVSERVAESVRAGLARLGHNVDTHAAKGVGSVKAILIDPRTGVLMGGAAPATDSYVIGW